MSKQDSEMRALLQCLTVEQMQGVVMLLRLMVGVDSGADTAEMEPTSWKEKLE